MPHIPYSNQPNHCLRRTAPNDQVLNRPRSYDMTQNLTKQRKAKQDESLPNSGEQPSIQGDAAEPPLALFFSPTHALSLYSTHVSHILTRENANCSFQPSSSLPPTH
ncbi:uncharacterized protein EAE97_008807 [Botrytis byssoidea]|uniref:Uncharacterized protein n=1 Tax=Botrytis byssoidea TaxID=139641 RepID=A0A9P5I5W2_9HELO|nr:uncharacterized protein EAE97_008807 [Botrytis byssoidea]KAF7933040.1 hypothetical protein EAE97_008807 [Botrytis byssoidea]